ncbi:hypothetical protein [Streptomyces sp. B1I3]|uniref:hypothetical protein n=1 Tax=Streptomyces sp. B1I3 TaxID=3042264 RepID=UPI002781B10C|nr:hypothetical protein [Streptomyces sp. B1I3]MDQ0795016.1 hypothetical protein [Streptomyces sp. B1I3]
MSGTGSVEELGAHAARARAVALLRIRSRAAAVAILPAAAAVVLLVAYAQGRVSGAGWDAARWAVTACAAVVLLLAVGVAVAVARARPAVSPTVPLTEEAAPDLYRLVRDLADRLDVPAPSAVALTPDCDSWLEDRTHPAARPHVKDLAEGLGGDRHGRRARSAPVLVIGSPFLWWMRVAELRAVLAPVVAGTGPSAHPDIAAARRFVRGLDAAVADASASGGRSVRRIPAAFVGWIARLLLRGCRGHAAEMERCVAAAASVRAQEVDYGLRIAAQEQVGLAYAGWDRLLTRVALPAWRMGRWPSRLDAGVVSALTELSRRDRLAEGFTSRLGERPACDLIEEPGAADEAASLLAARLFHGGPAVPGPGWSPVDWQQYPEEVVDLKWRTEAARLHHVLDAMGVATSVPVGVSGAAAVDGSAMPTLARVIDHLTGPGASSEELAAAIGAAVARDEADPAPRPHPGASDSRTDGSRTDGNRTDGNRANGNRANDDRTDGMQPSTTQPGTTQWGGTQPDSAQPGRNQPRSAQPDGKQAGAATDPLDAWGSAPLPVFPLQPPRTGTELLADHVVAMVCCAAVDTAGAAPGLDWLDGPALLVDGGRRSDLSGPVLSLVEDGDAEPLRIWLSSVGVRADKPVRLV